MTQPITRVARTRRDRHGRGLRGPLAPSHLPITRSRSDRFDELVLDAVERLEGRWAEQLDGVEFAVEDVPPNDAALWSDDPVPLSKLFRAAGSLPPRVVVYRRPVEARAAGREELRALVYDIVVEEVAELFGLEPDAVDPHYAGGEEADD
jgi:predicted Zn-dependent protease with MMP-like domain